jgi:hypothetical protein
MATAGKLRLIASSPRRHSGTSLNLPALERERLPSMSDNHSENNGQMWECKECHTMIDDDRTIAYHLVDRILYGWCETCFSKSAGLAVAVR